MEIEKNFFEGSLVLEKLAEIGQLDPFWEAIDSDDHNKVRSLLQQAKIDRMTINGVLQAMNDNDGKH